MAAFLIDRQQSVKIGDTVSSTGYPNGGVHQGTLSGPKNFLVQINDLQAPCPMFNYVDDSSVYDSEVPLQIRKGAAVWIMTSRLIKNLGRT